MFSTPKPVPVPGSAAVSTVSRTSVASTVRAPLPARRRVLDRVGQCFLQDPVQREAGNGGQPPGVPVDGEGGVGARGPELVDQGRQPVRAGQRRGQAARTILVQHPDGHPHFVQALPAQALGLGQRPRRVRKVVLDGQPGAGDVQERHGEGVGDDIVEFAGDPVAFRCPRSFSQARLGLR